MKKVIKLILASWLFLSFSVAMAAETVLFKEATAPSAWPSFKQALLKEGAMADGVIETKYLAAAAYEHYKLSEPTLEQFTILFLLKNNLDETITEVEFLHRGQTGSIVMPALVPKENQAKDATSPKEEEKPIITSDEKDGMQRAIENQAAAIQSQDEQFKTLSAEMKALKKGFVTKDELSNKLQSLDKLATKADLAKVQKAQTEVVNEALAGFKTEVTDVKNLATEAKSEAANALQSAQQAKSDVSKVKYYALVAFVTALVLALLGFWYSITHKKAHQALKVDIENQKSKVMVDIEEATGQSKAEVKKQVDIAAKLVNSIKDVPEILARHDEELKALNQRASPVSFKEAEVSCEVLEKLNIGDSITLTLTKSNFAKGEDPEFQVEVIKTSEKSVKIDGVKRNKDDARLDYTPVTVDSMDGVAQALHKAAVAGRVVGVKNNISPTPLAAVA